MNEEPLSLQDTALFQGWAMSKSTCTQVKQGVQFDLFCVCVFEIRNLLDVWQPNSHS